MSYFDLGRFKDLELLGSPAIVEVCMFGFIALFIFLYAKSPSINISILTVNYFHGPLIFRSQTFKFLALKVYEEKFPY